MSSMTIGEFEEICHLYPDLKVNFAPYECGSWRGVYSEACLFVNMDGESYLEDFIPFLQRLKNEEHYGYKGGEYTYDNNTLLNFEPEESVWSDGDTFQQMLSENPVFASVVEE